MILNLPSGNDTLGNNISAINQTFEILDAEISNLAEVMNQNLIPLLDFYKINQQAWTTAITTTPGLSGDWNSMTSTVQQNSAVWMTPLWVMYPNVIGNVSTLELYNILHQIFPTWLNTYYAPIVDNVVQYTENQVVYLSWPTYTIKTDDILGLVKQLTDVHHCQGSMQGKACDSEGRGNIFFDCASQFDGLGGHYINGCAGGPVNCNIYTTCPFLQTARCMFATPTGYLSFYDEILTTNLSITKDHLRQDALVSTPYKVQGCSWVAAF